MDTRLDSEFSSFAEILQHLRTGGADALELPALFARACDAKLDEPEDLADVEREAWELERNTWTLVQALYEERLSEDYDGPTPDQMLAENPYAPPLAIVQSLIASDKSLTELNTIRHWLHSIPTPVYPVEVRKGFHTYTKNRLKHAARSGQAPPRGLVGTLDPDATVRTGGRLDADDAAYDKPFLRTLYEYVRLGRMDLALDVCRTSDQSWRAATLRGGQLWNDPSLINDDEAAMDLSTSDLPSSTSGNPSRQLWKSMCRKLSTNPNLDPYERALYGALSGALAPVLPVCATWEDHLWARVNALMERRVDESLHDVGGWWIERELERANALALDEPGVPEGLEAVFEQIRKVDGAVGAAAQNPYHVAQQDLILSRPAHLISFFAAQLPSLPSSVSPELLAQLLRFFSHLILFLRALGRDEDVPSGSADVIIEAYVRTLELRGESRELVALYAGCLGEDAGGESYARFLHSLDPQLDIDTRRAALLQTSEHGLDLARVASRTVELTLADTFMSMPDFGQTAVSLTDFSTALSQREVVLIRSLEWLTFAKETYPDALGQTNGLMRFFLSSGKIHASSSLLFSLPGDLLSAQPPRPAGTEDESDQAMEYAHYRAFFDVLQLHSQWSELWSRQPSEARGAAEMHSWVTAVRESTKQVYKASLDLLQSEWLKIEIVSDTLDGERRAAELARIRQIYIPELVHRLHHVLFAARTVEPSHLQHALELPNVVADERHKLYTEFLSQGQNSLPAYLDLVRAAALACLDEAKGGRDPFQAPAAGA